MKLHLVCRRLYRPPSCWQPGLVSPVLWGVWSWVLRRRQPFHLHCAVVVRTYCSWQTGARKASSHRPTPLLLQFHKRRLGQLTQISLSHSILCLWKLGCLQNKGTFLWNFVPNSRRRKVSPRHLHRRRLQQTSDRCWSVVDNSWRRRCWMRPSVVKSTDHRQLLITLSVQPCVQHDGRTSPSASAKHSVDFGTCQLQAAHGPGCPLAPVLKPTSAR